MGDYRDDLRREVERHRLPEGTFERLSKRRDRRRRNRQVGTALLAVVVAAAGSFGLYRAFGGTGEPGGEPSITPSFVPPTVTTPGPSEPSPSPSVTPTPSVRALAPAVSGPIQFVDADHGWMVGADGGIEATGDGGHTWTTVYSGLSTVTQIDFVDAQHGWGVSDAGLVRTSDGGTTWDEVAAPALTSVQFLTALSGWGVQQNPQLPTNPGEIVRTNDGGATWSPPDHTLAANSVCFVNESLGWAAGPHGTGAAAFRTDDGGASWSEIPAPIPGGDQGWNVTIRCGGAGAWMVATGDGAAGHTAFVVFRSDGETNTAVLQEAGTHPMGSDQGIAEAANPQPGPVVAFDESAAAVVTWCPPCGGDLASVSFERTDDAGVTWAHPDVFGSNVPAEPLGTSFVDPDHGWVLVGGGVGGRQVLATTDGGETWAEP
jgi:photosystem II stability/assembly factor-like uncharacterized protein